MSGTARQATAAATGTRVNDIHSRLNETVVAQVVQVDSVESVRAAVLAAGAADLPVAVSGGRHAMGGQQFCSGGLLLDTRPLSRVLAFDRERGVIEVEAGTQWPELLRYLRAEQDEDGPSWGIRQKQTGANNLSIGGALAANVHGRGLTFAPIVSDIESFTLVDAQGEIHNCSRVENADLFRLAVGGYGLFGAVYSVRLRLTPRTQLQRVVEVREIYGLVEAFDERIAAGFRYGDFQFSIDPADPMFLRRGVFSCYRPLPAGTPIPAGQQVLTPEDWLRLLHLAHVDKAAAWEKYTTHYLMTSGQVYLSDAHQFAEYMDDYHPALDRLMRARHPGSEMITEIFLPRARLEAFMTEAARYFRTTGVDVVYGTVRLTDRDNETLLAWAREPWACVIFNLHTIHTPAGIAHSAAAFRHLIDLAIMREGSYYLTYHRWADAEQLLAAHPQIREFLERKSGHDPEGRFATDWYRHYARLLT